MHYSRPYHICQYLFQKNLGIFLKFVFGINLPLFLRWEHVHECRFDSQVLEHFREDAILPYSARVILSEAETRRAAAGRISGGSKPYLADPALRAPSCGRGTSAQDDTAQQNRPCFAIQILYSSKSGFYYTVVFSFSARFSLATESMSLMRFSWFTLVAPGS